MMEFCDVSEEESSPEVLKQKKILDSFEGANGETYSQKEILKQFKKNLSDILTPDVTDITLFKFLRARNYNLRKSEEVYRLKMMTRAVFKIDELIDGWDVPEIIRKYEFAAHLGIAKDGTPIRYMAMGRGDLKAYVTCLDAYDIGRYCTREIEKDLKICKEQSIKLGREIHEVTYVVDFDYFSIGQAIFAGVTEFGLDLFNLLQDHYPEIWKNILAVNAPFYFQTIFSIFKPIFRNTFLQNVHVVSKENTPSLLLKYIDAEVLPAFLGGERVDSNGDHMCSEFLKFGGIIPERYFLRNRTLLNPTDYGVEEVWLRPKCCYNISVVAREANSIIRVEFRTEGGSMPSMILYRKFGPDPENPDIPGKDEYLDPTDKKYNVVQCSPFIHLQTHYAPIDNFCFAPWPGIYIFRLVNYNWLTQRRCIFRFRVLPPDSSPHRDL